MAKYTHETKPAQQATITSQINLISEMIDCYNADDEEEPLVALQSIQHNLIHLKRAKKKSVVSVDLNRFVT